MKYLIAALTLFATTGAYASCGYVYVDGQPVYVCDYRQQWNNGHQQQKPQQRCGYVYVDGHAVYVCS